MRVSGRGFWAAPGCTWEGQVDKWLIADLWIAFCAGLGAYMMCRDAFDTVMGALVGLVVGIAAFLRLRRQL